MSWFVEDKRSWTQRIFGNILRSGPLPKHIAIIMDGNRRYANNRNLKKIEGHISGFEKLVEALNWCFSMEVKEVTVFAFSIENFKRSPDEVNGLFDLAREKFQRLLNEKDKIDELQVCIRMFGNIALLPEDLQQTIAKITDMTKDNKNEIDQELIGKHLFTGNSRDVDLLVRTSGEVRLSDFMLWQSNASVLSFVNKMWPEFSIWNFYYGIIHYQLNYNYIQRIRNALSIKNAA